MTKADRERIKAKAAEIAAERAVKPPVQQQPVQKPEKADKPKQEAEPNGQLGEKRWAKTVVHTCGHECPNKQCSNCRQATLNKRRERKKPTQPPVIDRLPFGATKHLVWNGTVWNGTLTIAGCPEFTFMSDSEKRCFHGLHRTYQEWLAKNKEADNGRGNSTADIPISEGLRPEQASV